MENWKDPDVIFQKAVILAAVRRADLRELEAKSRQLAERFQQEIHQVPIET